MLRVCRIWLMLLLYFNAGGLAFELKFVHLTCPEGYELNEHQGDFCYMFPDLFLNWNAANSYCRSRGGYLAQPFNAKQLSWVKKVIEKKTTKQPSEMVNNDTRLEEDSKNTNLNVSSLFEEQRRAHVWLGARADPPGDEGDWKWYWYESGGEASGYKFFIINHWNAWGSDQPSTPENSLENREELCLEYWHIDDSSVSPWNNNNCKRRQKFICQSGGLHWKDAEPESLSVKAYLSIQGKRNIFTCELSNPQYVRVRRPKLQIRRKKPKELNFTGDPVILQFLNDDMTPNQGGIYGDSRDSKVSRLSYSVKQPTYNRYKKKERNYTLIVTHNDQAAAADGRLGYLCELCYWVAGSPHHFSVHDNILIAFLDDADLTTDRAHSSTLDLTIFVLSGLISLTVTLVA